MKAPSDLVVYDCEQGGEDWFAARRGRVTSSEFQKLMVQNGAKKGRMTLLRTLAGERVCGASAESYVNEYLKRGKKLEPEALDWYARTRFADLTPTGFVYDPALDAGWSPDALIGDDGALEIKTMAPHLLIPVLEQGEVPTEFIAQCQGGALWVGRRKWVDLVIFFPGMPKFVRRIVPAGDYIAALATEVAAFNRDLYALVDKVKAFER